MVLSKKLFLAACLVVLMQSAKATSENQSVVLTNPMLEKFDSEGFFNGPFVEIMRIQKAMNNLIKGDHHWKGALVHFAIKNSPSTVLDSYMLRVELLFGASFISITPENPLIDELVTCEQKNQVQEYIEQVIAKPTLDRILQAQPVGAFTGSYAINPVNGKELPVYVSDYNMAAFDSRTLQAHVGVPAHHIEDFAFAKNHNLPIQLVINVPEQFRKPKLEPNAPVISAPIIKNGQLAEPFIGKYDRAYIEHSDFLNGMLLEHAHDAIIAELEKTGAGYGHTQTITYTIDQQALSVQELIKLENALNKGEYKNIQSAMTEKIQVALQQAQSDFVVIIETFLANIKKMKIILNILIKELCTKTNNMNSYLLEWGKDKSGLDERKIFQRDITSFKSLGLFCKDLLFFLHTLIQSCPKTKYHATQQFKSHRS